MKKCKRLCIVPDCSKPVPACCDFCGEHFRMIPVKIRSDFRNLARALERDEITEYAARRHAEELLKSVPALPAAVEGGAA